MILHLISSPIFLSYVINQFENVNKDKNEYYYIYSNLKDRNRIPNNINIKSLQINSQGYFTLIDDLAKYDVLILHSLKPDFYKFVLNAPEKLNIVWIVFGFEIYEVFKKIRKQSYLPKTWKLFMFSKEYIIDVLKPIYRFFIGRKTNKSYTKECLKRIDYVALTVKKTLQYLIDTNLTKAQFIEFGYYSIEETIGKELIDKRIIDDNILLGNSSSWSNNHLDAFDLFNQANIKNKKIFVPLSYGEPYLRKRIAKAGYHKFGNQFIPLVEFLPKQEYNEIMLQCGFVIMNHMRPQARGNIITALWLGAKVFLNRHSIYYQELKDKGLLIYSTAEIEDNPDKAFQILTISEVDNNRKILSELYNYNLVLSRVKKLVEITSTVKSL